MIIIFEGPDGAGKTTLAKQLAAQLNWEYMPFSYPRNIAEMEIMIEMYRTQIAKRHNYIFDRAWHSDMVYAPVVGREISITPQDCLELEELLVSTQGGLLIYCTGPKEVLWERCQKRGEDYITDTLSFDRIYEGYEKLMQPQKHLIPVLRYEYTEM